MLKDMTTFFVCTFHRSGGFLLMTLLDSTGLCGNVKTVEMFSRTTWKQFTDFPYDQRNEIPNAQLLTIFNRMCESQGEMFFGSKIFPRELPTVLRCLKLKGLPLSSVKWIWLQRRDVVRQAISYCKGKEGRKFFLRVHDALPDESGITIDNAAIERRVSKNVVTNLFWESFFKINSLNPLCVYYEDFMDESKWIPQVEQILDFLEISYESPLTVSTHYMKQSTDLNERLYKEFLEAHRDQ